MWPSPSEDKVGTPIKVISEFNGWPACAPDLRRGFCSRWARKVTAAVLMRLARHSHISTTMAYYVSLSADEIGADLWATHEKEESRQEGNISGNIGQEPRKKEGLETSPKSLF